MRDREDPNEVLLGQELRATALGLRAAAPSDLRAFARTVALRPPEPARRIPRRFIPPAIAAALVAGIALTGIVMSIRDGQTAASAPASGSRPVSTPSPGLTGWSYDVALGGWGWKRVGDPAPGTINAVGNGFIGRCALSGVPAICTSHDGVDWVTPPDPAILTIPAATAGSPAFEGWSVARGKTAWVATNGKAPGVWRSSDGRTWSPVDIGLTGVTSAYGGSVDGVLYLAVTTGSGETVLGHLLRSTDGTAWTRVPLPTGSLPGFAGDAGVTAASGGQAPALSILTGGDSWKRLSLPDGMTYLGSTLRLQSGGYVGIASNVTNALGTLVTSADGLAWTPVAGFGVPVLSLVRAGGHVLAIAQVANTALTGIFEITTRTTWTRLAVLDGSALQATGLVALGDRIGMLDGSRLAAVGAPLPPGTPGSPTPRSTPTTAPIADEIRIAGGWRWHRLNLSPGEHVVRLPKGYLARCGDEMCTSPNGWAWQAPPDPAIFASDDAVLVTPFAVTRRPTGGNYVLSTAEGIWYSADGVRWRASGGVQLTEPIVLAGSDGFAAIADVRAEMSSRLFISSDGVTWERAPASLDHYFYFQQGGDTSAGVVGGIDGKTAYVYSTDGRHWASVRLPKGSFGWFNPRRLADGSLIAAPGGDQLVRSTDGRSWSAVASGAWQPYATYLAVQSGHVLVQGSSGDRDGLLFESTDSARTFHQILTGVSSVRQLGDLAAVTIDGILYAGAPLGPNEAATTPTPEKPLITPTPGWTPEPLPTGGISEEQAIRIAIAATPMPPAEAATARASVQRERGYGRWVWEVSFSTGGEPPSPTGGQGIFVEVDYFTGEVLSSGSWIS